MEDDAAAKPGTPDGTPISAATQKAWRKCGFIIAADSYTYKNRDSKILERVRTRFRIKCLCRISLRSQSWSYSQSRGRKSRCAAVNLHRPIEGRSADKRLKQLR